MKDYILALDNSRKDLYEQCHQKDFLRNVLGIRGIRGSTALRWGGAWHAFLHGFYEVIRQEGWGKKNIALMKGLLEAKKEFELQTEKAEFIDDYRTLDNLNTCALQYLDYFGDDDGSLKIIFPEEVFEIPFELTVEEQTLFPFQLALPKIVFTGQIDLQVEMNEVAWIWEAKTTGQALSIQSQRLHRSAQIMGYSYAQRVRGINVEGVLISFCHFSSRKNKDGVYGKLTTDFQRVPHIFTDGDLVGWRKSFISTARDIYLSTIMDNFPMRHSSCFAYNRRCSYAQLCEINKKIPYKFNKNTLEYKILEVPEGFIEEKWDVRNREEEGRSTE
jgi:hypothetical protein